MFLQMAMVIRRAINFDMTNKFQLMESAAKLPTRAETTSHFADSFFFGRHVDCSLTMNRQIAQAARSVPTVKNQYSALIGPASEAAN
jgi:hypothetical protein